MIRVGRFHALGFMVLCLLVASSLRLPDLQTFPPGLHFDEAANGTLAAEIARLGERPVFIPSYTGKEVLFFYLAGGLMRAVGETTFALRLTSAFVGLLTVSATYWLGWELFANRRIALIAAVLLAVSFWHLLFSRLGFRAITQPLLQALAVAALFRGIRLRKWVWLIGSGLFLGLTAYTYLAARLFPLLLLPGLLPLFAGRDRLSQRWRQFALVCGAALLILIPLLGYFTSHPDAFWVRINQVAPDPGAPALSLGESYLRTLKMLFLSGDPYWRFNIPDKPLFGWFWGGLLLWGWATLLLRWRALDSEWRRSAALIILLGPFVMMAPSALATNEIVPSNLRAIGMIPFLFYLPAAGLESLVERWEPRLSRVMASRAWIALGGLILAVGAITTHHLYFDDWGKRTELFYESDGDLAAVARFADDLEDDGGSLFVSALHYRHPTLAFLSARYEQIRWLPRSEALVFPATGAATYIYPRSSPLPEWAVPLLAAAVSEDGTNGPDGQPAFVAYRLNAAPEFLIPKEVHANFGDSISLLGYDVTNAAAGETIPVTLYWQIDSVPTEEFTPFFHLLDSWLYRWSQMEPFVYPVEQWRPGDTVVQHLDLPVPLGTPPGQYQIRLGLFSPESSARLPLVDRDGRYAGDSFAIENVQVEYAAPPVSIPEAPHLIDQQPRPGLQLLGYERAGPEVTTGEIFHLALWWHATAAQSPANIRLEMMRADNTGLILLNTQPVHDTYPFQQWPAPLFLIDHISPHVPASFSPGAYRLFLRLMGPDDKTLLTADLGSLKVVSTERLFKPPPISHPLAANFGNEIDLLGYQLEPMLQEYAYTLSLVWRAQAVPADDYTVFVHLLGPDGVCCVWQQDAMPLSGQYPTGRWLAGEVVVDVYQIDLPDTTASGNYPIEVGLYISQTGRRLQVTQPGLRDSDAVILHPLQVAR